MLQSDRILLKYRQFRSKLDGLSFFASIGDNPQAEFSAT